MREYMRDRMFGLLVDCLSALFRMNCLAAMAPEIVAAYDKLLLEHYEHPNNSRLKKLVPSVGRFFTPLPFSMAWDIYDEKYRVTLRRFVPPTYHEVRHIMNIAQVIALRTSLRLVTFDGDETLYPDGHCFENQRTASYITTLLRRNIYVAVVTAAGYGYQSEKYEERLRGLLDYWQANKVPGDVVKRFYLFGGESNYLLNCNDNYRLGGVPEGHWRAHQSEYMKAFFREEARTEGGGQVQRLLDTAEEAFQECIRDLHLRCSIVRKERAIGIVPGGDEGKLRFPVGSGRRNLKPEILEEVCFRVRRAISVARDIEIPNCAFNGGSDVWVDVGNKAEGIKTLQSFLDVAPESCCHVGDQFLPTGNDLAARDVCPTLWIINPDETNAVLRSLLKQMTAAASQDEVASHDDYLGSDEDEPADNNNNADAMPCRSFESFRCLSQSECFPAEAKPPKSSHEALHVDDDKFLRPTTTHEL